MNTLITIESHGKALNSNKNKKIDVLSFNSVNAFGEKKKKLLFGLLLIVLVLYSTVSTAQWSPTTTSTSVPINRTGFVGIGNSLTSASGQNLVVGDGSASGTSNLGQLYNGTFGASTTSDIWSTLGGPPSSLPGNYGLRLNAGQQSINIFLNRTSTTITDKSKAILRWSDNSCTTEVAAQPFFIQSRITNDVTFAPRTIMSMLATGSVGIGTSTPAERLSVLYDESVNVPVPASTFTSLSTFISQRDLADGAGYSGIFVDISKKTSSNLTGTTRKGIISISKDAIVNIGVSGSAAGDNKGGVLNIGLEGFADIKPEGDGWTNIAVSGTATRDGVKGSSTSVAIYGNANGVSSSRAGGDGITSYYDAGRWAGFFFGDVGILGQTFYSSDKKLKTKIVPLENNLSKIMKVKPSSYFYNDSRDSKLLGLNTQVKQAGFIAQELAEIFPNLVADKKAPVMTGDKLKPVETVNYKAVDYLGMIPYLTGAIQEQQAVIETQQAKLALLESKQIATSNPTNVVSGITGNLEFVNISPNPTNGMTTISLMTKGIINNSLLMIIDLNGKVMEEHPLKSNELDYTFDASNYPKGLYIATYSANGAKPVTRTFVVQ